MIKDWNSEATRTTGLVKFNNRRCTFYSCWWIRCVNGVLSSSLSVWMLFLSPARCPFPSLLRLCEMCPCLYLRVNVDFISSPVWMMSFCLLLWREQCPLSLHLCVSLSFLCLCERCSHLFSLSVIDVLFSSPSVLTASPYLVPLCEWCHYPFSDWG